MRTKTTLAAAAILAAGLASSMAQNVYSLNVVGYVNNALSVSGATTIGNPLRAATGTAEQDRLDKVFPANGANDGDQVQFFNGAGWVGWTMDSAASPTTGYLKPDGVTPALASDLPFVSPGVGIFYVVGSFPATTQVTVVGEVRLGVVNVSLPSGATATSSPLPYSGPASTGPINLQVPPDGSNLQKFIGGSWVSYSYSPDGQPQGDWLSAAYPFNGVGNYGPEPTLAVGEGFFYENQSGATKIWTQSLTYP